MDSRVGQYFFAKHAVFEVVADAASRVGDKEVTLAPSDWRELDCTADRNSPTNLSHRSARVNAQRPRGASCLPKHVWERGASGIRSAWVAAVAPLCLMERARS